MVPACGELEEIDRQTIQEFKDVKEKVEAYLEIFKFREAQKEAMNLARIGNKYIAETEPWKLWKTDPKRVETISISRFSSLPTSVLPSNHSCRSAVRNFVR